MSGVQGGGHLEDQADQVIGHSHLNHGNAELRIRRVNVSEFGFTDSFADDGGDFRVIDIALAEEFLGLLAAEGELQESVGSCFADIARGDHCEFETRTNRADG